MTPDRLQQIEELYHSIREAPSGERAALLEQSDPELRREVESLLARQNDCLILDRPTQLPGESTMTVLNPGARLGPYQIESKLGEGGMGEVFRGVDTLTGSRMVIGTPAYMAPEQREGKPADVRTDLYSFGCIFHEMLTGARATSDRKPVPSKMLEKIVSRCLEKDPARRWQSAVELVSALEAPQRTGTNRIWIVPAAAILVALLIAGYFLFRP